MKKAIVLIAVLLIGWSAWAQDRGISIVAGENLGSQANIGKQYALFIAIDAYRSWPALKKPVADAREIRDILKQDYYIDEVIELFNQQATMANITRTFTDLQAKLGVHDSLFIYYAGHGYLDEGSGTGFWIPVDGGTDHYAMENWLPNSVIRGYISRFKTIHVFMVSDACFSGDILNTTRALPPQIDNAYFRKAYGLTSRQVLTSGSSETVPDQSEFSAAIKNCLRKNTAPLIDPISIYNDVRLSVRSTTPLYGTLSAASHQDGATFLFFRKQAASPVTPAPQVAPPPPVAPAPAPEVQPAAEPAAKPAVTSTPQPSAAVPSNSANANNTLSAFKWLTNRDAQSTARFNVSREFLDGKEREVLTVEINLSKGDLKYAGIYAEDGALLQKLRTASGGVRFKVLGDGKKWLFGFSMRETEMTGDYHSITVSTRNGRIVEVDVPFSKLKQPDWGKKIPFNKNGITSIKLERISIQGSGPSTIKVFDWEIY
jgi:hypothetical protein